MSTIKQKKFVREVIKNAKRSKPLNVGKLVENGGYSKSMAKNPYKVLGSKGVKKELNRLGFSTKNADQIITKLLKSQNQAIQLKACQEIYKRHGAYAPEKRHSTNVNTTTLSRYDNPRTLKIVKKYEDELRKTFQ